MIPEADGRPLPPIDSVWVIEAPGKIAHMQAMLRDLGYAPEVVATRGHFIKMPDGLAECGIDETCQERTRRAAPDIVERLAFHIKRLPADGQVYIATDADTEGEVIATDVMDTIADYYPYPLRVRLRALDRDTFERALDEAAPVRREDATPGRTRAIIDRLIGSGFAARGIAAGRIRSAILGIVARDPPPLDILYLEAPAADGGREWTARTPVAGLITPAIAEALSVLDFPPLDEGGRTAATPLPDDMGRILVRAGDEMDMAPRDAARAMQAAYESGRLSYPRSDARGISEHAADRLASTFRRNGQAFQRNIVAVRSSSDVHDSPWPIGPVNPSLDPRAMGGPEGVRTMIAQTLLRAGRPCLTGHHRPGVIPPFLERCGLPAEVALFIDALDWTRSYGPRPPGASTRRGIVRRRADTALLEACVAQDLGRPSTYAGHIAHFMESGLIDQSLHLTEEGQRLVNRTPEILLSADFSRAIEKACKIAPGAVPVGAEPWQVLAKRIVDKMPGEVGQIVRQVMRQPIAVRQAPAGAREVAARAEVSRPVPATPENLRRP